VPDSDRHELEPRPKRKISKPARYSENVMEPPSKKRRTTKLRHSTSPPPTSDQAVMIPSDPGLLTSSNPVDNDMEQVQPAGYGLDFLNNFIDDTPRSSTSALDSVIGSAQGQKSGVDPSSDSDALPEAAGLVYDTFTNLTSKPPVPSFGHDQSPIILSSTLSSLPQQNDDPEARIKKLQVACHALGGLSIPPVPPQNHQVSPVISQSGESET
jgi:hypothetical protein